MAGHYHKPGPKVLASTNGQQRQLIVKQGYYAYQGKQQYQQKTEITEIPLKGNWLAKAGFQAGESVTVKVMDGCLILIKNE
ncbi:SymE family type I addiction module toxin [Gammaproteobacteria bacterium AH-315-C21]|nr:SymE family type I addiction module toxin [Gammaproteobacteria bacterium AH-315-C21]